MSEEFGAFIVLPFDPRRGDPAKNTTILDELCARPNWTQAPLTADERRANFAILLTNPQHGVWEVWHGGKIVGILTLHGIVPRIEAILHFVFFDRNLVGKRALLRQFIAKCFRDFQLRRLVMHIPEPEERLIRFARSVLGFSYEGEHKVAGHVALDKLGMENPQKWVAEWGSRKEAAHCHDGRWVDVIQLRLLADDCKDSSM